MCGRFTLTSPPEAVRAAFGYDERPNFPPRYNIAPTQPIAIVREAQGKPSFHLARWGLIPSWVKDIKALPLLINARAETAADKPAFRAAFRRRRCLIPADGWYEWQALGKNTKRPFYLFPAGGGPLALAGLWETYMSPDGAEIDSAAIITTDANAALSGIHNRMPVILAPTDIALWLDPFAELKEVSRLMVPAPDALIAAHPVSARVNSVANDDAGLIAPAEPVAAPSMMAPPRKPQLDLF